MGSRRHACAGWRTTGVDANQRRRLCADGHAVERRGYTNTSHCQMNQVGYPFSFDNRGRSSDTTADDHIPDLIEQVLFTSPGERVNRPTFGCGLNQHVFAPNSPELAAATQFLVQGALQQWLGDLILVDTVQVDC